jgi:Ca-activated chloride channel family protein
MHLWNDRVKPARIVVVLFFTAYLIGQDADSKAAQAAPAASTASVPASSVSSQTQASAPANGSVPAATGPGTTPAPKSGDSSSAPQDPAPPPGQNMQKDDAGMFVLRKQVDEVALHATVIEDKDRLITNLDRSAFTVYEDGQPQAITSFRHEDIPVAMAIVIDNSGSMREKREKVNQAALNLVRSSNARDEVIIVNFNDEEFLDQDFTSDIGKLKEALGRYDTRGGTALYDAVDGAAEHLKRNARLDKKVVFVVTDGEDNASRDSLEQAAQALQQEGGPTVYAIGLLGGEKERRARRALQILAERTGGIAFFPKTLDEVDQISKTVAQDIRNQYAISYKPTHPKTDGGYRVIRVDARASGHHKLTVRTKTGYYATQKPAQ